MGRTACTEPQWLYKGAVYLYLYQAGPPCQLSFNFNFLNSLFFQLIYTNFIK